MVHQFKNNGYNILLDVSSGAIHVVDDVVYDVVMLWESLNQEEIFDKLKGRYDGEELSEAIEEVAALVKEGELFTDRKSVG